MEDAARRAEGIAANAINQAMIPRKIAPVSPAIEKGIIKARIAKEAYWI